MECPKCGFTLPEKPVILELERVIEVIWECKNCNTEVHGSIYQTELFTV